MATVKDLAKYRREDGFYDLTALREDELAAQNKDSEHAFFDTFFGGDAKADAVAEGNVDEDSELMALARSENERIAHEREVEKQAQADERTKAELRRGRGVRTGQERYGKGDILEVWGFECEVVKDSWWSTPSYDEDFYDEYEGYITNVRLK